ncbi:hypothetical protein H9L39_15672 [Fusarium oxysporum f. sp. albedinis]|nr:hypothetical protein H9L39_15672 [Fusarium oxysporum f. sp. albedinis]
MAKQYSSTETHPNPQTTSPKTTTILSRFPMTLPSTQPPLPSLTAPREPRYQLPQSITVYEETVRFPFMMIFHKIRQQPFPSLSLYTVFELLNPSRSFTCINIPLTSAVLDPALQSADLAFTNRRILKQSDFGKSLTVPVYVMGLRSKSQQH